MSSCRWCMSQDPGSALSPRGEAARPGGVRALDAGGRGRHGEFRLVAVALTRAAVSGNDGTPAPAVAQGTLVGSGSSPRGGPWGDDPGRSLACAHTVPSPRAQGTRVAPGSWEAARGAGGWLFRAPPAERSAFFLSSPLAWNTVPDLSLLWRMSFLSSLKDHYPVCYWLVRFSQGACVRQTAGAHGLSLRAWFAPADRREWSRPRPLAAQGVPS